LRAFEDVDPRSVLGSGDVKYHVGATGEYRTRQGRKNWMSISHRTRAIWKRSIRSRIWARRAREAGAHRQRQAAQKILPIVLQRRCRVCRPRNLGGNDEPRRSGSLFGSVARSMSLSIICSDSRTRARRSFIPRALLSSLAQAPGQIPIFFTSMEKIWTLWCVLDRSRLEYRQAFREATWSWTSSVYRRHGHSEVDDPDHHASRSCTRKIKDHPPAVADLREGRLTGAGPGFDH